MGALLVICSFRDGRVQGQEWAATHCRTDSAADGAADGVGLEGRALEGALPRPVDVVSAGREGRRER
eukprot:13841158-Alexandrium_andersonii.AAC.1